MAANRIETAFKNRTQRALLIPFLNVGDPTLALSLECFRSVIQNGAGIVEIGVPYSDPLADGPVIQASALRSLNQGFALPQVFDLAASLRSEFPSTGLVLFTYFNPILQYGYEAFFRQAASSGADGVIVPDLPFEESHPVREVADAYGVSLIPLIAPTSGPARIKQICDYARGFVYCVSSLGVTGERAKMSDRVEELVNEVRQCTDLPVCVGFGVSTGRQANEIANYADGVIVGSAFIRRITDMVSRSNELPSHSDSLTAAALTAEVAEFARTLHGAVT